MWYNQNMAMEEKKAAPGLAYKIFLIIVVGALAVIVLDYSLGSFDGRPGLA